MRCSPKRHASSTALLLPVLYRPSPPELSLQIVTPCDCWVTVWAQHYPDNPTTGHCLRIPGHDAWMCCCLQLAVPIGLSPPCALPLPAWPILISLLTLPFPLGGCANGAPGLSLFHCSVLGPHRGAGGGGSFRALASHNGPTHPPTSEKIASGDKIKFTKEAGDRRPISGTRTFFGV